MDNIQDLVAKTTKELILTEPFYGLFLIGINKKFTDQILGRRLRDHEVGPAIDMDYDP